MFVKDETTLAEGLGKFFETLKRTSSAKAGKRIKKGFEKSRKALRYEAKLGGAAVSKNPRGNFIYKSRCNENLPHKVRNLS